MEIRNPKARYLKEKADRYNPDIERILKKVSKEYYGEEKDFILANMEKDVYESTDAFLGEDAVGFRVRSNYYFGFGDLTIRSKVKSGNKTEIDKLKEGFGKLYFYGWLDEEDKFIKYWILVDLDAFRQSGLMDEERHHFENKDFGVPDGSYFHAYKIPELHRNGCLIAHQVPLEKFIEKKLTKW